MVLIVTVIFVLMLVILGVKIVPQSQAFVVERFGGYNATWDVGFHYMIPFIDRVAKRMSLKEDFFSFDKEDVITKDNVTLGIGTVVFYQIADPKLYTYGAENPQLAIAALTSTTLRNVIGELELDQTLTSRDTINTKLRSVLDEASDAWGLKVIRVELKELVPPETVTKAMELQMTAERQKRAAILDADGRKQSDILIAEGVKQSTILQAEATKEAAIKEAEGEAQAILSIQKATADGLNLIKQVIGEDGAIKLKSFETFAKVADGQSTKIIIPSELQNLASVVASFTEIAKK